MCCKMYFHITFVITIFSILGCILAEIDSPNVEKEMEDLPGRRYVKAPNGSFVLVRDWVDITGRWYEKALDGKIVQVVLAEEENFPKPCFKIYAKKLNGAMKSLARTLNDIHASDAINLYKERTISRYLPTYRFDESYLERCESLFGGKLNISLQPLNKYRNDSSRPLPPKMALGRNLCEDLCVLQATREAVLPNFDPVNHGEVEILKTIKDPVVSNAISEMCEWMFDVQIKCTFEQKEKMPEQTEKDVVAFLLRTTLDIKNHLKLYENAENVHLPGDHIGTASS